MGEEQLFPPSPEDTHTQLMKATYEALCEHGYSELTIQRIGDEFPKSKSLIYQHYDGKDDLLVAFLEFLLEQFEADVPTDGFADAREHMFSIIDHALPESLDSGHEEFLGAVEALRGQAPHNETYREQFRKLNDFYRTHTADVIRAGIDQGVFRDVDPERTAGYVVTTIHGARSLRVTVDSHEPIREARTELETYVREELVASDAEKLN
ncbi:TetR/AcrR family transcriptional regulator [Halobiforma nitratireducens]|uniref:Regulatory protein TetR n=1 Tax=Halobiforma nitratireducens JCM 10879 TaxID=1227454 RepID=M0M942_9EURY|nr:TetR/AcrR family transcriptional regulator [Halobiforma nitratireducens]EMA40920.1 regulatory protein TetR [Halobiforma nitratireducens JCM 10879]